MKILFTNSPLHYTHGHTFTQPDWQTLVLPLLAAIVRDRNHEIRLVDNMTGRIISNRIIPQIQDFKPDVVGFSIIAARDIYNTLRVIKRVRRRWPQLTLIAGGQASTSYEELLLRNGVNFVVRGEGEVTLKELMQAIADGVSDYSTIRGISFAGNGRICKTGDRPRIKNLDDSPFPAIDLMPPRRSRWFPGRLTGSIETSRGCAFGCNFCAITSFWERSFREKSNERIIDEIKFLTRRGRSHLYLADDNFGMNVKKHVRLFEAMLREGLDIRFFAQMRTDTIALHGEMMKLAARAGLYGALIGFDTYDPDTFHHVAKVGSVELNLQCAEVMRKNRIMIFGSHIYGLPTQKKAFDFARTFWLGHKNSDLFRMPYFSLLPGTQAYGKLITDEMIKNAGERDDDFRLLLRPKKKQRRFKRWYTIFNYLNMLFPDEIFGAFFHRDRNVRTIKRFGYWGILRHKLYKHLRRVKLTDI